MGELLLNHSEFDEVHGEDSGVDFRGPVADYHNKIAKRHDGSSLDVELKIDNEWISVGNQFFEPGDEPGTLKRYVYNHKKEVLAVGVIAVGSIITALAASRYVAKRHRK